MPGQRIVTLLRWPAAAAVILAVAIPFIFYGGASVLTLIAALIGFWICIATLLEPGRSLIVNRRWPRLSRSHWGMIVAHFGVGVFMIGATFTSAYDMETEHAVSPGDRWAVGEYEFVFNGTQDVTGPNYDAVEGDFELYRDGELIARMNPQERIYRVQRSPMTEAAIDAGAGRDVFVALGQLLGEQPETWSVRVRIKPLIRFIWIGTLIMVFGGLLAISDRRYRTARSTRERDAAQPTKPVMEH